MKRKLLISLMAAVMLMSACSDGSSLPAESTQSTSAAVSQSTQSGDSSESSQPPQDSEQSVTGTPLTFRDMDGVMGIELPFEVYEISNICSGKIFAVSDYTGDGFSAALIDAESMTYVSAQSPYQTENGGYYSFGAQFINGLPVVVDYNDGKLLLLDEELNIIDTMKLPTTDFNISQAPDASALYIMSMNNAVLHRISEKDGKFTCEDSELQGTEGRIFSYVGINDVESVILCVNEDTWEYEYYMLDSDNKVISKLNVSENESVSFSDGKIFLNDFIDNQISVFSPDKPFIKSVFAYPANSWILNTYGATENLYFCAEANEKLTVSRMSPTSGSLTAQLQLDSLEECFTYVGHVTEYRDKVFLAGRFADGVTLCMWQPEDIAADRGWNALQTENYGSLSNEIAEEIESSYGIEVRFGDDAVRYFSSYAVISETNERRIYSALSTLRSVLAKFPSGFLKELTETENIEILLTGRILSDGISRDSITTAEAFTSEDYDNRVQYVVIDISTANPETVVPHEFMHVIENAMCCMNDGNYEVFMRWGMLNPEDFEYSYVYTNEDGSTITWHDRYIGQLYYEGGEMSADEVYFVNGYATTYPCEDRATMFENMFSDELPAYFSGSNMQLKANYLCVCIRECFRSLDGAEDVIWERNVDTSRSLEWFRENYSDWAINAAG